MLMDYSIIKASTVRWRFNSITIFCPAMHIENMLHEHERELKNEEDKKEHERNNEN